MPINHYAKPFGQKAHHFRQTRRLALASAQAADALWEFRWGVTDTICLVNRVILKGAQIGDATAEELRFNLKVARSFTAADDTNTVSIKRTGDMQKMHGSADDTVLSEFVESNSATGASGGTFTLDTDAIAQGNFISVATNPTSAARGNVVIFDFNSLDAGEHPLRLGENEGWVISLEAQKGATTGVALLMEASWSEIEPFPSL